MDRVALGEWPYLRPSMNPQAHSEELGQLMQRCWAEEPSDRPEFNHISVLLHKQNRSVPFCCIGSLVCLRISKSFNKHFYMSYSLQSIQSVSPCKHCGHTLGYIMAGNTISVALFVAAMNLLLKVEEKQCKGSVADDGTRLPACLAFMDDNDFIIPGISVDPKFTGENNFLVMAAI